jgi:hypothetical protein
MNDAPHTRTTTTIVQTRGKSIVAAVLLAMFFGPLGLLYASAAGGLLMTVIYVLLFLVSALTFGMAAVLFVPAHLICLAWAALAASSRPREVLTQTTVTSPHR